MENINQEGVTLLSKSEGASGDQRHLNIIFVHGLRGHPRRTWSHVPSTSTTGRIEDTDTRTNKHNNIKTFFGLKKSKKETDDNRQTSTSPPSDIFWPEEYLVPDLPQARIWTYGYNADVIGGLFQANNQNSVSQHGRDFADLIVFVAHSLGGIITKDALHRSETICKRTKLIVFLGTPHRGSTYAGWGVIASNLASIALQDSNKQLVQTLEVNDEVLDNIHEEFKTILTKCAIKVHSFQEARGISGMKGLDSKVVDNFSSKLDLAREQETVETIDANHMEMARCSSRDDARYRQIFGVLKQFTRTGLPSRETNPANNKDKSFHPALAKLFTVPFSQDEHFIGREDILDQLDIGGQQGAPKKHRRHALVGLGGVGKSQIAIEYAYRARKHHPQISVFWIHASTKTRFEQAYQEIAERLELPGRSDPKANVLRLVYNWLSDEANGQWHMVLDNVDDGRVFFGSNDVVRGVSPHDQATDSQPPLETFLPQSRNGLILITSRNLTAASNLVDTFGKFVPVEPMEEKDSVVLLKTKIPADKYSEADVKELVQALEGIPLAITHAAAYIRLRPRVTVSKYLSLFWESEANQASLLNSNETKDLRRDHSIRHAVITTWQISFDQIQLTWPEAADMLALMSMFDRQSIPERLLHNNTDQLLFEDSIAPLINFSLIREHEGGTFEMHRLVQLSTRKWVELNGQLEKWRGEAIKVTARLFPNGDYETWSDCQILLPHVRMVMSSKATDQQDLLGVAEINTKLGWYYIQKGETIQAEPILQEAIVVRERELGVNHPDTFTSVSYLGLVLEKQGKYEEADTMHRRALEGREKALGGGHPHTLASVNNLGLVLEKQGKYQEAEAMHWRALEGSEKVLGVEHPETLTSVNNLALVLSRQGKYEEAEVMHRRDLQGSEKVLGVEHPHTLAGVCNLGSVLLKQGKYEESAVMHWRALEGYEKVLGVEHPDTITSVSNLGMLLKKQRKYEESEMMHRRALEGREKALMVEHPHTLASVSNLGSMLLRQGKYKEAEIMHRRALEGREKVLGVEHPHSLTSMANLASTLWSQRQWKEAEDMEMQVMEIRQRVLGHEHPDTLMAMDSLAFTLKSQNRNKEATSLMESCFQLRERVLGRYHPDTESSLETLNVWQMESVEIGV
ncbi:hypothetical protein VE03_10205 [Pseudogymnoascus sp. 23342-1-I1]|nr:hypothetical protein VE03_10205 [Pseudogymnoascus sp. 23342-1-I1]